MHLNMFHFCCALFHCVRPSAKLARSVGRIVFGLEVETGAENMNLLYFFLLISALASLVCSGRACRCLVPFTI